MAYLDHTCPICQRHTRKKVINYPLEEWNCSHKDSSLYKATFRVSPYPPVLCQEAYHSALYGNGFSIIVQHCGFHSKEPGNPTTTLRVSHTQPQCPILFPFSSDAELDTVKAYLDWHQKNPPIQDTVHTWNEAIAIPRVLQMKGFW